MKKGDNGPRIGAGCRAELWLSLSTTLAAGLPPGPALRAARDICDGRLAGILDITARAVEGGMTFSLAGTRSGLLGRDERALTAAADDAGVLAPVCAALAGRYRHRFELRRRVQGKLWLPGLVLLLGIFLLPLPSLFTGSITLAGYGIRTVLPVLLGVLAIAIATRIIPWRMPRMVNALGLRIPGLAGLIEDHGRVQLLSHLALLLDAGVTAGAALPAALACVSHRTLRTRFAGAVRSLASGAGVAAALRDAGALDESAHYPVVSSGEHAGRLAESLSRVAELEGHALRESLDFIGDWIPRVIYILVLVALGSRLVGSGLLLSV